MALIRLDTLKTLPLVERLAKFLCYLDLREKYGEQFEVKTHPSSPIYIDNVRLELFWKNHLSKATMIVEWIKESDPFMTAAGNEAHQTDLVSAGGIWLAMVDAALSRINK